MSHTPGPWVLNGWDVVKSGCVEVKDGLHTFPALAAIHNGDGKLCMEEINANARLIAAAPELLMACRMLVALEDGDAHEADTSWKQARKIMRSAIAKAEGRGE